MLNGMTDMDRQFKSQGERINEEMEKSGSYFTNTKCTLCGKRLTNKQLAYSNRFFKKPLCFSCQKFEDIADKYRKPAVAH